MLANAVDSWIPQWLLVFPFLFPAIPVPATNRLLLPSTIFSWKGHAWKEYERVKILLAMEKGQAWIGSRIREIARKDMPLHIWEKVLDLYVWNPLFLFLFFLSRPANGSRWNYHCVYIYGPKPVKSPNKKPTISAMYQVDKLNTHQNYIHIYVYLCMHVLSKYTKLQPGDSLILRQNELI